MREYDREGGDFERGFLASNRSAFLVQSNQLVLDVFLFSFIQKVSIRYNHTDEDLVRTPALSKENNSPIPLINASIIRFDTALFDKLLNRLSYLYTFSRVSLYAIRVVHERDALAEVPSVKSDTYGVILVSPPNCEFNLVSVRISVFWVALNNVCQLAGLPQCLHIISVPFRQPSLPVLLDIILKRTREPL